MKRLCASISARTFLSGRAFKSGLSRANSGLWQNGHLKLQPDKNTVETMFPGKSTNDVLWNPFIIILIVLQTVLIIHRMPTRHACGQVKCLPVLELLSLTLVPELHRTMIPDNPAVDLCLRLALRTHSHLTNQVTMVLTYAERRRQREIRQLEIRSYLPDKLLSRLYVLHSFT